MDIHKISFAEQRKLPLATPRISAERLNFGGLKGVTRPDTFEISPMAKDFQRFVDKIMAKIQDKTYAFTPEKLEKAINATKANFPDFSEKEILTAMQRLTQWADYSCMKRFAATTQVGHIEPETPVNNCFFYFQRFKKLFPTRYLGPAYLVATESELEKLSQISLKDRHIVNLEGFEQGVNIFTDNNNLEKVTAKTLKKVQQYQRENPAASFNEAIYAVLNSKIINAMKALGKDVETIQLSAPPTRSAILEQMSPFKEPSRADIVNTIELTAQKFTSNPKEYEQLRNNLAEFYAEKLNIFTKQKIIEALKEFRAKFDKYFQNSASQSSENSYLMIPYLKGQTKSFDVIAQMYKWQNGIPDSRVAYINDIYQLNQYPPNATFILLDDMTISGNSLSTAANYHKDSFYVKNDRHILFCPIYAHETGLRNLDYTINCGRHGIDDVITLPQYVRPSDRTPEEMKLDDYFLDNPIGNRAFGLEGYRAEGFSIKECLVFPYMTPDNNPDMASFITHLFLPDDYPIKSKHIKFKTVKEEVERLNFIKN